MNIFGEIVWLFFFDKNKLFYSRRKEFKIISIYYAVLFFIFIINKITPKLYTFSPVLTQSHICIKCTMNQIIIIILIGLSELQNSFLQSVFSFFFFFFLQQQKMIINISIYFWLNNCFFCKNVFKRIIFKLLKTEITL